MIGIYCITNKINGHKYVGQSIDIERRFKQHIKVSKEKGCKYYNYPLYKAFRKYGVDNFEFEILKLCDKNDLTKYETEYYEKLCPKYNQIKPDTNPIFDKIIEAKRQAIFKTDEYKKKCSKKHTEEHKLKISTSIKNSKRFYDTHRAEEFIERMRKIHVNDKRAMRGVKCSNGMEFISLSAAGRWVSENTTFKCKNKVSKIKSVCDCERKTAFGFTWSYK